MIRQYQPQDAAVLAHIFSDLYPDAPQSVEEFRDRVVHIKLLGGLVWVLELDEKEVAGFAWVVPVPGLPHIAEMEGGIMAQRQRQGWGTSLLQRIMIDLKHSQFKQLSYPVECLKSPAACLLQQQQFFEEHSEWVLMRNNVADLPGLPAKADAQVVTFGRATAVSHFTQLYTQIFKPYPWYQPFTEREVADLLDVPTDILFLDINNEISGFAWLHINEDHTGVDHLGVIEPFGIAEKYQGQGYGRYLLSSAMFKLVQRGAQRLQIGAWTDNQAALHLYQSLGFQHQKTITYLAYDLH